ncbi:MAG: TatD family hydrolase, partial [Pseudomonadota bacterium]
MVIDSHCHLDYPGLVDNLEAVLARADAAGIRGLLTIGTRLAAFEGVRTIAERHRQVWCSVGVHPHEAGKEPVDEPGDLIAASDHPKVVGIGESGLDFFYDNAPRDRQETNFRVHIDAARQTGLPLIVHTRDADEATAAVLAEEYAKGPFKGVLHCFTGGAALARAALD